MELTKLSIESDTVIGMTLIIVVEMDVNTAFFFNVTTTAGLVLFVKPFHREGPGVQAHIIMVMGPGDELFTPYFIQLLGDEL